MWHHIGAGHHVAEETKTTIVCRLWHRVFMRVAKWTAGKKAHAVTKSRHTSIKWIICVGKSRDFSLFTQMSSEARSKQRAATAVVALASDGAISSQSSRQWNTTKASAPMDRVQA